MINTRREENKNSLIYQMFCLAVLFCNTLYRGVKKAMKGKCGKKLQLVFSLLALGCLAATFLICASLEQEQISLFRAILLVIPSMAGFGLFCDFAGAFRPYRYLKKQGARQLRNANIIRMPIVESRSAGFRKSA